MGEVFMLGIVLCLLGAPFIGIPVIFLALMGAKSNR